MNRIRLAVVFGCLLLVICLPNSVKASIVVEYGVMYETAPGVSWYASPITVQGNGFSVSANLDSLDSTRHTVYDSTVGGWLGGWSYSAIRLTVDSVTTFDVSFDYSIQIYNSFNGWAEIGYNPANGFSQIIYVGATGSNSGHYTFQTGIPAGGSLVIFADTSISNGEGVFAYANISRLSISPSPVPVPPTAMLLGSGLLWLFALRGRFGR